MGQLHKAMITDKRVEQPEQPHHSAAAPQATSPPSEGSCWVLAQRFTMSHHLERSHGNNRIKVHMHGTHQQHNSYVALAFWQLVPGGHKDGWVYNLASRLGRAPIYCTPI